MSLDEIVALLDGPFGYSRALAPGLRSNLRILADSQELPFVRGRTVIPGGFDGPVIVGYPNYLGVFEDRVPTNALHLTSRWSGLRGLPAGALCVETEPSVNDGLATEALRNARLLSKRLRQLPGVEIAFKPQSPIVIVLAPRVRLGPHDEPGMTPIGSDYPELPGGIRIELAQDAGSDELSRYAASLEQTISQEAQTCRCSV